MHNNVHVKSVILSHKWKAKTLSIGLLQRYDGSHWETKTQDVQVQQDKLFFFKSMLI